MFDVTDANWRGIRAIPASGYALKEYLAGHDAIRRFDVGMETARERAGEIPPGCDRARVELGKVYLDQCALYGKGCTPRKPIGP